MLMLWGVKLILELLYNEVYVKSYYNSKKRRKMSELKRLEENDWELLDDLEESIKEYEKATRAYSLVSDEIGPDDPEFYNEDYGDEEDSPYELLTWRGESESMIQDVLDEIKDKGYNIESLKKESSLVNKAMKIIENN